ncbi:MAG: LysM peptidoglycan-binding domain-containing protein [Lachnospiraceae bacterium]|nr:LysM peptidoglycan-binding domain-containing protein [Lachnospiraceae bacterium]
MELPKNITQIGETNPHCKIYVEDYVISYIRQLNQYAGEKGLAVALYGTRKEENEITYLFLYGACKLNFLQRECRHLSQAVTQEAEKQRKKYFPGYVFLGYRLLDGEMVEGFHICEQGVCRYVEGYAQFYEKNDQMLAFMLDDRQGEAKPEEVSQDKYDMVKKRQEERRALLEEKPGHAFRKEPGSRRESGLRREKTAPSLGSGRLAVAAAFILLCGAGFAAMGGGDGLDRLRTDMKDWMEDISQKQLPDAVEVSGSNAQVGTIVAEDKLADAIRKENTAAEAGNPQGQPAVGSDGTAPEAGGADGAGGTGQTASGTEGQQPPDRNQSAGQGASDQNQSTGQGTPDQNQSAGQGASDQNQSTGQGTTDRNQSAGQGASDQNQSTGQGAPDQNQSTGQGASDQNQSTSQGTSDQNQSTSQGTPNQNQSAGQGTPDQNQSTTGQGASDQNQSAAPPDSAQTNAPVAEMAAYIVRRGDTMTDICIRQYGSDARVAEVCALNNISNPDDIKEGEKIFLPQ